VIFHSPTIELLNVNKKSNNIEKYSQNAQVQIAETLLFCSNPDLFGLHSASQTAAGAPNSCLCYAVKYNQLACRLLFSSMPHMSPIASSMKTVTYFKGWLEHKSDTMLQELDKAKDIRTHWLHAAPFIHKTYHGSRLEAQA